MRRRRCVRAVTIIMLIGTSLLAAPADADQVQIQMIGAFQMSLLGSLLANEYIVHNPGLSIAVVPATGPVGINNACYNSTIIGMSELPLESTLPSGERQACGDLINVPIAVGAEPVVYNLPGAYVTQRAADNVTLAHPLRLTPAVLVDVYLGSVTRWNDPAIARLNPGMPLPDASIHAFHDAEPGAANGLFSTWLAQSDLRWRTAVGVSPNPVWPRSSVEFPSSAAVVQAIQSTPYSLGFTSFDAVVLLRLQAAALMNASGTFVSPSLDGLAQAVHGALRSGMPSGLHQLFVGARGPRAFDPSYLAYVVVRRDLRQTVSDPATRQGIKSFLSWMVSRQGGQSFLATIESHGGGGRGGIAHGYIPLPPALAASATTLVRGIRA